MKIRQEIEAEILKTERDYSHLLTGSFATAEINAPRALGQVDVVSKLQALHWVLGTTFKSKLKGVNR